MFVGLHVMLAQASGEDAWAISDEDGEKFMRSAQNVMRHYGIKSQQKTLDWIAFGGSCVSIYGPRIGYVWRKQQETRQRRPLPLRRGEIIRPAEFNRDPPGEEIFATEAVDDLT